MITIFTPVYNRAHLLARVYNSLQNQHGEFEWVVVNDGSSDNTDEVMQKIIRDSHLQIKYIATENGGKHRAHNVAVRYAEGELFLCLDSDDWLCEDAVSVLTEYEDKMQENDWAMIAYKKDQNGVITSKVFPETVLSSHFPMNRGIQNYSGSSEYCFVFKTSFLEKYPFPEVDNERFIGECVLYDRLELDGYTSCIVPYCIESCEYQSDGLSASGINLILNNPTGFLIYHMQRIDLVLSWKTRVKHIISYHAFRKMSGNKEYVYRGKHRFFVSLLSPIGIPGAWYYKRKGSKE